uniref:ABC1 atypical kinase-like domain-containing protein n=1 Tax=Scylla olivacea TaxID=85551 RepID=A0A0N7ZCC5_SCYOL
MAVRTLSRVISLTAVRNALLQPFHYGLPLPVPSHYLSQSLTAHSACQPQSLGRLYGKGTVYFQLSPGVRIKSAETYCQTIASCRNARKNLVQGIQRAVRKACRTSVKRSRMAWQTTSLGMAFLAPSLMHETKKPVPVQVVQPEVKRKTRGWWSQLFANVYEFLCVCLRALRLLATFTPILMLYPVTYLGKTATDTWWGLLLTAIEFSGPILIKLGQWASTRRDLFPDTCCSQFSRLQRRIKPHSWRFTRHQMKRAFGPNWRKVFVKFDNDGNPIGSGCVAQVYKVWMSAEAIPDEELLEEILSEMDDEGSIFEGLEVMGLRQLFSAGLGLLGISSKMDPDNLLALKEFYQLREERRSREREKQKLLEHEAQQAAQGSEEPSSAPEVGKELPSVDTLPSEESEMDVSLYQAEDAAQAQAQEAEDIEDAPTHQLVEEWQEAELDKSLPVSEGPLEDMEGLVPVAVKVLHPSIAETFRRDLRILKACASFVTILVPPLRWLSLPQCVEEFGQVLAAQIDLRVEAHNLENFSENFADIPFIKFPRPLRPYVTSKVLVETFEEGEAMLDVMRAPEESDTSQLKKRLAEIGVDALLKMVFVDNLVHGDLHPGNLLVQNITSGTATGDQVRVMMVDIGCDTFVMDVQPDPNPLRICFLDCGVTSRLTEQNLARIRAVFKQVVIGDGESVAELFLEHSEHECADHQAFKEDVDGLVQAARESTVSLSQVDVGVLLQQVLGVLLKHKVRLESAFSAVVLAIFVLEGLGRALDPDMDILERARPILVTDKLL